MKSSWLPSLLALCACSSGLQTQLHRVTVATGGEARDHITWAPCIEHENAAAAVSVAFPLLVKLTAMQGYASARALREAALAEPLSTCLVEEPMECCLGGWPCAPPCKLDGTRARCARKAGCATSRFVWVAKHWPPVCRSSWPDEPHCVALAGIRPEHNWRKALVHELGNVLRRRLLHGEGYDAERVSAFFAAGGPVHSTQALIGGL